MSKNSNKGENKAPAPTPAPAPAAPAVSAAPVEKKKPSGPVVAEGKSITTKRGILADGEPITPEDLAGGEEAFGQLAEAGYIVVE